MAESDDEIWRALAEAFYVDVSQLPSGTHCRTFANRFSAMLRPHTGRWFKINQGKR